MDLPVYLDHAATTPVAPEVLEALLPYFARAYGNPASLYALGAEAREAVEAARERVAAAIGADADEITFTSGGTEADNWAIKGLAARAGRRRHVLCSAVEHHAVLDACEALRRDGFGVERIPVASDGTVEPDAVHARIRDDTCIVSVMHANNEVGTIEPIEEIGRICREHGVPLHVDAVQSFGSVPVDVDRLGADLLTVSGHKIYGPKGVGALYVRRGVRIAPLIDGGGQESGRRAGTVNVPAVVGMGEAARLAVGRMAPESERQCVLRDRLIGRVLREVPGARLSGAAQRRLPNNAHFCIEGIEGEALLLALDAAGVCASAGSACTSGSVEPSHVLLAMGFDVARARGAIRMTVGRSTTAEDVDYAAEQLRLAASEVRALGDQAWQRLA